MNIRTCAALLLAAGLPTAVFAVDFTEIEPNETKAQALANGAFVLATGDSVSGTTTGTSTTTAGAASADTFLIKTTPATLGIYRHRLTITTGGTAGHTGTIRGLAATSTGVTAGGDSVLQTSSSSTTPARYNQWYGFGKQEQLYYRVTGTASTTGQYQATLSTDVVTPVAAANGAEAGTITISDATSATTSPYDNDMFLFDSNFNPIVGIDDPDSSGMVASLTPGTYYVAFGSFNTAAGRLAGAVTAPAVGGIQGTWQTGAVLDFDDLVSTSRTTTTTTIPTSISIAAVNGTQTVPGNIIGWGEVQWFTFNVVPATSPTNPTGTGLASPSTVISDGTGVTTLSVTVNPGANPTSTFVGSGSVTVDGSLIGAGTVVLLDNGVAPDLVAGDLIFTANATVAANLPAGPVTLPFSIIDDQARSGNGTIALTLTTPPPGCLPGAASHSVEGAQSDSLFGAGGANTIVTHDFGYAGDVNVIRLSGRATAFTPSWRADAEVAITTPEAATYFINLGGANSAGTFDFTGSIPLPALASGTGNWTIEFYEDFDDAVSPETTYASFCLTIDAVGACCTDSGCVVTDITNCTDVLGGTFIGAGTNCGSPAAMTADGGAFEDISATGTPLTFTNVDDGNTVVTLPFAFNYFGTDYTSVGVCTNGFVQFTGTSTAFTNTAIPTAGVPNNALYVMWDDLNLFGTGSVQTELLGTIGVDARFIIQWSAGQYNGASVIPSDLSTFQIALFEDGFFEFRYLTVSGEAGTAGVGDTTTFGFENADGTFAITLNETRDSLAGQAPISFRGTSANEDTGICGTGCPPCAADYDNNGGVDGGDLAAFFADFESGEACADVDGNGGVDGGDLGYFFFVFEQGGCD